MSYLRRHLFRIAERYDGDLCRFSGIDTLPGMGIVISAAVVGFKPDLLRGVFQTYSMKHCACSHL